MLYFTYIIKSDTSGRFYTGSTDNLERRLAEHQRGKTPSTRNRGPWTLVYSKSFPTKAEAVKWEMEIKRKKNTASMERIISASN
ncbi:MAG TPA: excinuclease ABC subunit C [Lentisphaeria bacterium]|nr:excinuclease ABC subunit C [Lentisphaeria bacterium]